jgi:hypothetical protein
MRHATRTSFKAGCIPHNRVERIQLSCAHCGKSIFRTPHYANRQKKHWCSPDCRNQGRQSTVTGKAVSLYNDGLKLREIAYIMGLTTGTVSSLIYKSTLKKNHPRVGYGRNAIRSQLPKSCELCGYSRCLDIAHIVPVRLGGKYSLSNCLSLCPNCHHLFDHNLLSENEQSKLKEIYASRNK